MLISWARLHPEKANGLVRSQPDGSYLVHFQGVSPVSVTKDNLAAAERARVVRTQAGDDWAKIVLTAFIKLKSAPEKPDFRSNNWIYAGEIASYLTGGEAGIFSIKPELQDAKGRIQVGAPVTTAALERKLGALRGKPLVAYTNRRIHIWAVLDYDSVRSRVRIQNPRRESSEWISVAAFRDRFQLLVYIEA